TPWRFNDISCSRDPPWTTCVCGSTRAGEAIFPSASITSKASYSSVLSPAWTTFPSLTTITASATIFSSSISLPFKGLSDFFGNIKDFMFLMITSFIIHSPPALEYLRLVLSLYQLQFHIPHPHGEQHPCPGPTSAHAPDGVRHFRYRQRQRPCRHAASIPCRHRRRDGHCSMSRRLPY